MYSKILVPVDGSETSTAGLNEAIKLAKILGSRLCLLHVVNEFVLDYGSGFAAGSYANDLFETLRKSGKEVLSAAETIVQRQGIKPTCAMAESFGGAAADIILEQAEEWHAELIVMGTHGRRGIFRLAMGSDAEQVLRSARVPVLLIRGQAADKKPRAAQAAALAT